MPTFLQNATAFTINLSLFLQTKNANSLEKNGNNTMPICTYRQPPGIPIIYYPFNPSVMKIVTTLEELQKAITKINSKANPQTIIEMAVHNNSIVYKLPDANGVMITAAYQQIKTIQP